MSTPKDGGAATCKTCKAPAHKKTRLCPKHYRFQQMRSLAKRRGLAVPSRDWLESEWRDGMRCGHCRRKMNLLAADGSSTVVTLQHNRDGTMCLLCLSCNSRHARRPGDSFYDLPPGLKVCPGCEETLALEQFSTDRNNRWGNRKTYCRACSARKMKDWRSRNREEYNEKRRAYYHKRIADGNPIPRQS